MNKAKFPNNSLLNSIKVSKRNEIIGTVDNWIIRNSIYCQVYINKLQRDTIDAMAFEYNKKYVKQKKKTINI